MAINVAKWLPFLNAAIQVIEVGQKVASKQQTVTAEEVDRAIHTIADTVKSHATVISESIVTISDNRLKAGSVMEKSKVITDEHEIV